MFEKLCVVKSFNNTKISLFENTEQHYKFTIGNYTARFYMKDVNYSFENRNPFDDNKSFKITMCVGSAARKNIKKIEKLLKKRFEDKNFDKIILNGKIGKTDSFWILPNPARSKFYIDNNECHVDNNEFYSRYKYCIFDISDASKCDAMFDICFDPELGVCCDMNDCQIKTFSERLFFT